MTTSWEKRWNRPPTEQELTGMIDQYIREIVLYNEAITMGLDQNDTVIRRRLAQKVEFLAKDLVAFIPPSEEDLTSYFDEHKTRYQQPDLFTFTQVFIDPDKRGDATLADAEVIKAKLVSEQVSLVDAPSLSDGFMLQNYYPGKDPSEIQKLFGSGFTKTFVNLETGQWHGPVLSGYGVHLIYIQDRIKAAPPTFESVREQVTEEWDADKREELNEQFYTSLRKRYNVVIEKPAIATADLTVTNLAPLQELASLQEVATQRETVE